MIIQQVLFIAVLSICFYFAYKSYSKIYRNIHFAKGGAFSFNNIKQRWNNTILIALGQKKMFKRIVPAFMHLFIYVAFLLTQVELLEIFIDGIFGQHRFFSEMLGGLYVFIIGLIEFLSVLAFIATIVFLSRRNLLKLPRFTRVEMLGWPFKDGNLILIGELLLLIGIFSMNGADTVLQSIGSDHYHQLGGFLISEHFGPAVFGGLSESSLIVVERFGWWLHFGVVMFFLLYLPISKHLHIFLAFPNVFFANLASRGEMENMPEIMNEVKMMMGLVEESVPETDELPEFGANDVFQLSKLNLLNAYSCTECGRCTDVCPASSTGKKLSPRKIMMDVRDRVTEVSDNIDSGDVNFIKSELKEEGVLNEHTYDDGKSLFDSISREEIHACTTCNACVEACPILISPLDIILKLRRYEVLTESAGPADWLPMFTSIENSGSVWQVPDERDAWKNMLSN